MSHVTGQETSKAGELDYVVTCGNHSQRFGEVSNALHAAWDASLANKKPAHIFSNGKQVAAVTL